MNNVAEQGSVAYAVSVMNPANNDIRIQAKTRIGVISEYVLEPKPTPKVESVLSRLTSVSRQLFLFKTLQQTLQQTLTLA